MEKKIKAIRLTDEARSKPWHGRSNDKWPIPLYKVNCADIVKRVGKEFLLFYLENKEDEYSKMKLTEIESEKCDAIFFVKEELTEFEQLWRQKRKKR